MSFNEKVSVFCKTFLEDLCKDIAELESTGVLPSDSLVRKLAQIYRDEGIHGSLALTSAEALVKKTAVDFVIENYNKLNIEVS